MPSRPDPRDIHGGDWEVYEITPEFRRSRLQIAEGQWIIKTEVLADEALLEMNRQDYDASHGKRFGDGRVVARVPLNKFYQDLAPKIQEGDRDHLKWWLDREEARPFRSFRGRIS